MKPRFRFPRRRALPSNADIRHLWQVNKYLWMSLAFVLVFLASAQALGKLTVAPWIAWSLFALALADGIGRTLLAYRAGGSLADRWAWLFTGLDILLISAGVAITGGIQSEAWLLYFVVMIFESLFATREQKRLMDISVSLAYLLATLPSQILAPRPALPMADYGVRLLSRLFFLIMVSALARRIGEIAAERHREALRLREQMAAAEERARLAHELHDGLGHSLVSSILRLELCARLLRRAPEEAETLLQEEVVALRAAWNESRDLAFHLRPWELDVTQEGGLLQTLQQQARRFTERAGIQVEIQTESEAWNLTPEAAFGLIRIAQEALTNAAKHAQARRIEIRLTRPADDRLVCVIQDDGAGFVYTGQETGLGLPGMRDRAEALGGQLEVESAPGQGTRITVWLPK